MIIIGVDSHPEFQQIAAVDTATGDLQEHLQHGEEAENFYRQLAARSIPVRGRNGSQVCTRPMVKLVFAARQSFWKSSLCSMSTERT